MCVTYDLNNQSWQDIRHKGYLHIKGFLTEFELQLFQSDWSARKWDDSGNGNYSIVDVPHTLVGRLDNKMRAVSDAVHAAVAAFVNVVVASVISVRLPLQR
jgi:hypothetical protein